MSLSTTTESNCRISEDFDILRRTEVFSSAPAEVIRLFAYFAKHRKYSSGEHILTQGSKAEFCYFLISGEVDVLTHHKGHEIVVQRLQANSFFGELALLASFTWFFSVRSVTESELLMTDRKSFQKILERYPEKRERITEKIIQLRISRYEQQTSYLLDLHLESGQAPAPGVKPFIL